MKTPVACWFTAMLLVLAPASVLAQADIRQFQRSEDSPLDEFDDESDIDSPVFEYDLNLPPHRRPDPKVHAGVVVHDLRAHGQTPPRCRRLLGFSHSHTPPKEPRYAGDCGCA